MISAVLLVASVLALLVASAAAARVGAGAARALWSAPIAAALGAAMAGPGPLVISKALALLVMPAGLVFVGLVAVACAGWRRWSQAPGRRRRRVALGLTAALFAYWLAANGYLATRLVGWLERDYQASPRLDEPLDAIVLLGGGTAVSPDGRPRLTSSGDRVFTTARLFREGAAKVIVCTGSSLAGVHGEEARSIAGDTRWLLEGIGVPREAIVELPGPRNTSEEMAAVARLSAERGWQRIGVVTSAWHMPRVMRLARRQSLEPVPLPADHRGTDAPLNPLDLIPTGAGLYTTHVFAWELLGMAVGR